MDENSGPAEPRSVTALGGGVSNRVLLAETAAGRMVLKQALGKLRVEQPWYSDPRRIRREAEAIRRLGPHLPAGSLPIVLLEDPENCAYAMTAAPADSENWKARLMAGEARPEIAGRIGDMLAAMIAVSWHNRQWEEPFGDQSVFDELRLDPYYRTTAARHPDLAPQFERLMRESAARRVSLVHGDWSPKNFLVAGDGVMAIDFEVVHYGDPAFDAAFLLNHLALKSFFQPRFKARYRNAAVCFWQTLEAGLPGGADWMEEATLAHLGALMLARIDGKSPAEYLDHETRCRVREFARDLMRMPPAAILEVFDRI